MVSAWRGVTTGPSPLARGHLMALEDSRLQCGSIPARAGSPSLAQERSLHRGVHPRSRGVTAHGWSFGGLLTGPSPLARGHRAQGEPAPHGRRSIPARAGSPSMTPPAHLLMRVHPRSRGVTTTSATCSQKPGGPSPLARGHQPFIGRHLAVAGSIPARAGSPRLCVRIARGSRVHPRSRGVTSIKTVKQVKAEGPSPLARGHRSVPRSRRRTRGSIPARAGSPGVGGRPRPRFWVHPRSRGVTNWTCSRPTASRGPSPLARGHPPCNARFHTD